MERYLFFEADRIPAHLPVIGVPMAHGFVWMELTPTEYDAAVTNPKLAQQLVRRAHEVIATRLSAPGAPTAAGRESERSSSGGAVDADE